MPWPKTGATHYHEQLRLTEKVVQSNQLVGCRTFDYNIIWNVGAANFIREFPKVLLWYDEIYRYEQFGTVEKRRRNHQKLLSPVDFDFCRLSLNKTF